MSSSDHSNSTGTHTNLYSTSSIKDFLSLFNKKLEVFVDTLQHEQNILVEGTADEISHAAEEKLAYMQSLSDFITNYFNNNANNSTGALEQSLKILSVICVENNIKEWIESQNLIQISRELSDENSILLANRLKSTNSALDTLYSLTGSHQTNTYDNSGHSRHLHVSRQLASV